MTKQYIAGYPPWNSDDEDIILSASLTSSSDIGGGTIVGNNTSAIDFNSSGVQFNSASAIKISPTAAQVTKLNKQFRITLWVDKYLVDIDTLVAINETLLYTDTGIATWLLRKMTSGGLRARQAANLANWYSSGIGKPDVVRVDITGDAQTLEAYVDHALVGKDTLTSPIDFTNLYIGGNGLGVPSTTTGRIKNIEISTRRLMLPTHPKVRHINLYTDSYGMQGNYGATITAIIGKSVTGNTGTRYDPVDSHRDAGISYTIHRELAKQGIFVGGNRIRWCGAGGIGAVAANVDGDRLSDRFDATTGASVPYANPDISIWILGANDVFGSLDNATEQAAFELAYKTELDKSIALGCDINLVVDICNRTDSDYSAQIIRGNNGIDNVVNSYADKVWKISVHDESVNNPDFMSADLIHPDTYGHWYIGNECTKELIKQAFK